MNIMKLTVKTLKGNHFEISIQPTNTVMAIKKHIEDLQGKDSYPCGQQLLIYNGKVLKDETTLAENKVIEDGFIVVMLNKATSSTSTSTILTSCPIPISELQPFKKLDTLGHPASNSNPNSDLEQTIQQIIDIGNGNWDKEIVTHALRAAYNNPERAVEYLYLGIPKTIELVVPIANLVASSGTKAHVALAEPMQGELISSALNNEEHFQETLSTSHGELSFLRKNQQFLALRSMVQENPQILEPMLQELGKQNLQLLRFIQEHITEFLHLINEPIDGSQGEIFDQPDQDVPHTINVTQSEQEAIEQLEELGFDKALVIEAFLSCDYNMESAANYLLENKEDFDD